MVFILASRKILTTLTVIVRRRWSSIAPGSKIATMVVLFRFLCLHLASLFVGIDIAIVIIFNLNAQV